MAKMKEVQPGGGVSWMGYTRSVEGRSWPATCLTVLESGAGATSSS